MLRRLRAKQLRHRRRRQRSGSAVPLDEHLAQFRLGEDTDIGDAHIRSEAHHLQEPRQPLDHRLHGFRIEYVQREQDLAPDSGRFAITAEILAQRKGQVEFGNVGIGGPEYRLHATEVQFGVLVVEQRVHHLEEGILVGRAGRVDLLDDPLERDVLVVEGGQVG
ncbi:MAG TPA: hypothetical protein VF714_00725, partial [Jatrophihabitans sp.]